MNYIDFIWTDAVVQHLAEHGISQDDFEHVVLNPVGTSVSRTSGFPASFGHTPNGRYIITVYERLDDFTVLPITAYEVPEPG
jgi:hypothetical protein